MGWAVDLEGRGARVWVVREGQEELRGTTLDDVARFFLPKIVESSYSFTEYGKYNAAANISLTITYCGRSSPLTGSICRPIST